MGEKNDGMSAFGAWVQVILDERDITQKEFARLTGFKELTVGRWIRGQQSPTIRDVAKMAECFDCHVEIVPN